ncbi:hypothetical protein HDU88_001754 [Geranomyces variabilis]|nr:hypothetical protein HDU88_001754 [Geranomyces variabilis]
MHRRADGRNVNGVNLRQVYGGGIRKRHSSYGYQSYRPNRYPGSSVRHMNDRPRVRGGLRGYLDRELDDYMGLRRKSRVELSSSDAAELRGRLDHEIDDYMSKRKELEKSRMERENNVAAIADPDGVSEIKRRDISAELEAYLAEDSLDMAPDIIEAEVVEMVS